MNSKFVNLQKKIIELKNAKALAAFAYSPFTVDFFHKKFFELTKKEQQQLVTQNKETLTLASFHKLAKYNKHLNIRNFMVGKTYKTLTVLKINALNLLCVDEKGKKIIL